MKNVVFQALAEAACENRPVTLGIISGAKGSSPQKIGAKALFYDDGKIVGTLGGGCLEAEIQQRAVQALRTGEASVFDLLLDHDFGWDDGLICGGKVFGLILPNVQKVGEGFWSALAERKAITSWFVGEDFSIHSATSTGHESDAQKALAHEHEIFLYKETVTPPEALWIAGAGHIAQAVAPLAAQLDFEVTVMDDRPALASPSYFPGELKLQTGSWEKLLSLPLPSVPSFGLIVTRGHRHDALVLRYWIHKPFEFIGMIGSSRKARIIHEHFAQEHMASTEQLSRVACPVGVRIGSESVAEIAVSIMAQFIEKRSAMRSARAGRDRLEESGSLQ